MAQRDFWISVLKRLQPTISKAPFLTWFANTAVVDKKGGKLLVGVPTPYAQSYLASKYHIKILQAVKELDGEIESVEYEVKSSLLEKGNNEGVNVKEMLSQAMDKKIRKVRNQNEVVLSRGPVAKISSQMLNEKYRLENFVVGRDNRLPHAACSAVANTPGGIYNPLYIYGASGFGKTHLLQAIGNEVLQNFPDMVIKYLTAERFVSEVVDAIGKRNMPKFKDQYRNVDCFLIDDVQFFARKDSSQQEFFHTFNELYNANKQIVLTSDRPPSELDDLDERLKGRFGMGMVVELLFPDFETRLAILHEKCKEYEVIMDPELLSFIATNVHNSVRELEGVLRQAIAETELTNSVPTIRSIAAIIKRLNKAQEIIGYDIQAKRAEYQAKTSGEIMDLVAGYYKVSIDDLVGKARNKEIMLPRQVCMYLIKNELGHSYEKIGLGFGGRNHTTIMHSCEQTAKKLKKDIKLVRDINALKREMGL